MRRTVLRGIAGIVAAFLAGDAAACTVTPRARIPLQVIGGTILVEARVNGYAAQMILDTGAQRSLIANTALQRLDLEQDDTAATSTRGIGGIERNRNTVPRSLSLGGIALERRTLNRDTSLTVGTLGRTSVGGQRVDGLLGRDFLAAFDLELDLRAAALTLHSVSGCNNVTPPWPAPYTTLPVQFPTDTALQLTAEIDGVKLRALLDTGASTTVLMAPGMARLDIPEALLLQDREVQMNGIGPRSVAGRVHRFRLLRIGDIVVEQPRIVVAPIRVVPIADLLLGADWLVDKRVWISFATGRIFVTRR